MAQLNLKRSGSPLQCVLAGNTANMVRILAVSVTAQPPSANSQNATVAADGQSFTVPLNSVGIWAIVAVANTIPAPPSPILRTGNDETQSDGSDLPAGTFIDAFDDPATLATVFTLEVTA